MDYILFIHGVNTRERREVPEYANTLCDLIEADNENSNQKIAFKMVPLYWGNVNADLEDNLLRIYRRSPYWGDLSFKGIRENQLLQFTGDAALYISRYAGTRVVDALLKQVIDPQRGIGPGPYDQDRLHLVTHSWGTIIFFDVLFSARWDAEHTGAYQGVNEIRRAIFGLDPSRGKGLRLSSIHTMGSPISVFSLMLSTGNPQFSIVSPDDRAAASIPKTHDITPGLLKWLKRLPYQLPWYNYLHPEDPIAYPLQELIPEMLETPDPGFPVEDKLIVKDIVISPPPKILDSITGLNAVGDGRIYQRLHGLSDLAQAGQLVLHGGDAHHSYWTSQIVANRILQTIQENMPSAQEQRIATPRELALQALQAGKSLFPKRNSKDVD